MTDRTAFWAAPERLATTAWPVRLSVIVVMGSVAGLGQVPFALPVATLAALVAVFLLTEVGRGGFGTGWAFGTGYFALTLHWIVEPFLIEPERTGWMAPFALLITAAGFALFWGAAFGIARALRVGPLGLAVLWTGAEMVRSLALTGFPWALIGHVWSETPLAQLASDVGVHGLTLLTMLTVAVLASSRLSPALRLLPVPLMAAGFLLLEPGAAPAPDLDAPIMRVVQPNVPQAEKWDPELSPIHRKRMLDLSQGERPAALTVWPETAPDMSLDWAAPLLASGAEAGGGLLATGIARVEDDLYYNSFALADRTGEVLASYDKAHLVPFGEYMPFRRVMSRLGMRGLAEFQGQGFEPGPGPALIDIPGIGLARPLICYEGIFAEEIGARPRPRLLLLVTNDAWFGSFAGPQQHLALGRLRAIEQGLPLVRSANTGISAIIDGYGRVLASLPLNEAGAIEAPLPPALPATIYARTGDWPVVLTLTLLGLGAIVQRRKHRVLNQSSLASSRL